MLGINKSFLSRPLQIFELKVLYITWSSIWIHRGRHSIHIQHSQVIIAESMVMSCTFNISIKGFQNILFHKNSILIHLPKIIKGRIHIHISCLLKIMMGHSQIFSDKLPILYYVICSQKKEFTTVDIHCIGMSFFSKNFQCLIDFPER